MPNYNYKKIPASTKGRWAPGPKGWSASGRKIQARKIVKHACYSPKNKYGKSTWDYHISPAVKYSLILGKKLKADLEVLELSALFHDYACLISSKLYPKHHIHSAKLAEEILTKLNLPPDKIKRVKECILCHRASIKLGKKSIEAKILASADAMSHITELVDMFFLTFNIHGFNSHEGAKWLKAKLIRSWNKIMPQGKNLVRDDYKLALKILNKAISAKG